MPTTSALENNGSIPTKPHWFSYTQTTLGTSTICAISVVLDAGAQESFSGIRVIVVCKENTSLNRLHLKHCFDTSQWADAWGPSKSIFKTYRESKANYKTSRAQSNRLIENSHRHPERLPLCTIVLEVQNTGTEEDPSVCLQLYPDSSSGIPLRILYDYAESTKAFLIFLESNHIFRNINTSSEVENSMFFTRYDGNDSHVIRVLPVSGPRKPFPVFPFKIIRRIADEAFFHQYPGWRTSLLSCALVCKSWHPLVDMFFDTLGSSLDNNRLNPRAVSNSLIMQPNKGSLIQRVDYRNFGPVLHDLQRIDFSEALISVLRMSVFVKEVVLCVMPSAVIQKLLDALSELSRVEIFTMYMGGFHHPIGGDTQYPTIVNTQRAIANWTNLRVLKLSSWEQSKEIGEFCQAPSKCKLEHLWLKNGSLTGSQLSWFSSPYSKIRHLSLINILGLTNSRLSTFLCEVSPALEYLSITGSTIIREDPNEAYALDIAMSKMSILHTAHIHGDLLTPLSISTKPKIRDSSSQKFISVYRAPHMDNTEELLRAFETTGWNVIELASNNVTAWNDGMQGRALLAAHENGVRFICSVDHWV